MLGKAKTAIATAVEDWSLRGRKGKAKYSRLEASFLPAAMALQESPPSPTARLMLWVLIALLVGGLTWATLGRLDIVVSARGQIIPDDRVKTIQAATSGVVQDIRVADGDHVEKGDVLLTLDPTEVEASIAQLRERIAGTRLSVAMHEALGQLAHAEQPQAPSLRGRDDLSGLPGPRVQAQQEILEGLLMEFTSSIVAAENQIQALKAEIASLGDRIRGSRESMEIEREKNLLEQDAEQAQISKLESLLPFSEKEMESLDRLHKDGIVAGSVADRAAEQLMGAQEDLKIRRAYLELIRHRGKQTDISLQHRIDESEARIRELEPRVRERENSLAGLRSAFESRHLQAMGAKSEELRLQAKELEKLEHELKAHLIRSPAGGIVQRLAMNTVGGVVQPSQALLSIVPEDLVLEIEAFVENKDVGFVHAGQSAEIKVDTFPYTKYGLLQGKILWLSPTAVEQEGIGLVYLARVGLDQTSVEVEGKELELSPGMSVTAEVRIGERRIIEYFLAPLLRIKHESLRER